MRLTFLFFAAFILLAIGCERKLSAAEIKDNLEKAMSSYLLKQQHPGAPPLKFQMVDVTYYDGPDEYYLCDFKVRLFRPDGSDTTGIISSRVSKDFSKVSRR
jgi:hypothetical protein